MLASVSRRTLDEALFEAEAVEDARCCWCGEEDDGGEEEDIATRFVPSAARNGGCRWLAGGGASDSTRPAG